MSCKGSPVLQKGAGSSSSFAFKETSTQNRHFENIINDVGYFELNLHRHILGTTETYITSCKKEYNRCPLKLTKID